MLLIIVLLFVPLILLFFRKKGSTIKSTENKIVVITGCDTGVGFAVAKEAFNCGFVVVASCLKPEEEGGRALKEMDGGRMKVVKCDVTKDEEVEELRRFVNDLLEEKKYTLHAVVSNAGVLVFGDFQWQTEEQLISQIQVNTLGHLCLLRKFLPDVISHKGRIISVSSTCGHWVLPGLSLYAASKFAAEAVCRGIRVETKRFGVKVVNINPGEVADQTNILANQIHHAERMKQNVLPGDEEYFEHFHRHLTSNFQKQPHDAVKREGVLRIIRDALLDENPKNDYSDATLLFRMLVFLYKLLPDNAADSFLRSIMKKQIKYDMETKTKL